MCENINDVEEPHNWENSHILCRETKTIKKNETSILYNRYRIEDSKETNYEGTL